MESGGEEKEHQLLTTGEANLPWKQSQTAFAQCCAA